MKYEIEFNRWFSFIKKWEGGTSSDTTDLASKTTKEKIHTNRGVTFPTWQTTRRLLGKPTSHDSFLKMTDDEHREIAKCVWYQSGADYFKNGSLAAFFAEERWAGGGGAIRFYQGNFGLNTDSIVGSKTAAVANSLPWEKLHELKRLRYANIIKKKPSQKRFEKGWNSRISDFEKTFKPI